MKNKKNILIVGFIILLLLMIILFLNKDNTKKAEEITGFNYYSGSSSYGIKVTGKKDGKLMNIEFKKTDGSNQTVKKYKVTFNKFKELLNMTKVENCKKHTYEYQCGEDDGCSYSVFLVNYSINADDNVCYEVNYKVSSFFNNFSNMDSKN